MSEVCSKTERVKPLFQRMELFIDFCEEAVDRAFYMAGMNQFSHIPIQPSADDKAFALYAENCRKLWGIEQPNRAVFEKITAPLTQMAVGVKATNKTGG